MRSSWSSAIVVAGLFFLDSATATLDPIVIKGSKFFFKTNGTQFFIKGVAYQSGISSNGTISGTTTYSDPLADVASCKRDIPYLQQLGANAIRTYALDPTQSHDECMATLDAAGIYLISDLGEPSTSINRETPAWDTALYSRYTQVVDAMSKYDNVIGFFAGNEVTNNATYSPASAFVKAAVRDTKAHIKAKGYRTMGVGYAADDDATVREHVANYLNCGDPSTSIDFWGYNIYEWCGNSSYETSGYADRTAEFMNYNVPVFFAEYGCNVPGGAAERKFTEIGALYGNIMDQVFSGGIVYEYFQEENDYGLVSIQDDNAVSTLLDFAAFSTQIHSARPTPVSASAYNPTNTAAQACPTVDSLWLVAASGLPPTPSEDVCNCMMNSLTCTVASDITPEEVGDLFGQVCGYNDGRPCVGIVKNTTTGTYGPYSMCNSTQMLAYAFNAYYLEENNSQSCDFDGKAQIVQAAAVESTCSSIIASATANSPASPTSTGAASTTTKKNDAGSIHGGATLGIGTFCFVAYSVTALLSGFGMIYL